MAPVFEQRNPPADERRHIPGLVRQILQVAVPGKGHEDVGQEQQQRGLGKDGDLHLGEPFDGLAGHFHEQRRQRAVAGDGECGRKIARQFGQRHQHEGALVHARMRHHQRRRVVDEIVPVQKQVEVERARRVAVGPFAAVRLFDAVQRRQQGVRREVGVDGGDRVDVVVARGIDRRGAVQRGRAQQAHPAAARQTLDGIEHVRTCVAEVGADADPGDRHSSPPPDAPDAPVLSAPPASSPVLRGPRRRGRFLAAAAPPPAAGSRAALIRRSRSATSAP